jgi:peroxiredoxin
MKVVRNTWSLLIVSALIAGGRGVQADEPLGFKEPPPRHLTAPTFSDADIDDLLTTLDGLLAHGIASGASRDLVESDLWTFRERLQAGRLTAVQESGVLGHLEDLARTYPDVAPLIERERRLVRTLTIGKQAPDIVGTDLEGRELRLSDHLGSVVVLAFSGEWCGSCRLEYPYLQLLTEVHKGRPLAILSVNSDRDPAIAKKGKTARGLTFQSWWDGAGEKSTEGPIATAWGVMGWPTTYVLDESGVIRFVNLRKEDLLKAVRQLVEK